MQLSGQKKGNNGFYFMIWRAPFAPNRLPKDQKGVPSEWSGYSLQVRGLLRAFASLWAFRFYPCPMAVVR